MLKLHAEDIDLLLQGYEEEADLSKITKRDSAGILEIFTREDLERMQVHTLMDVLESTPAFVLKRARNNLTLLNIPSIGKSPLTYIRLYINDHELSSSSFGSGFLIWGEMPIEYIDHIEIYKANSSMEFGNENGAVIIKLYTKSPERENGSKVRLLADQKGSWAVDTYTGAKVDEHLSYFAYAGGGNVQRTPYYNTYNDKRYTFESDRDYVNVYGNIAYDGYVTEVGFYQKQNDGFIGIGRYATPEGGGLDAHQAYVHLSKKFDNGMKLQLSYDKALYKRNYIDPNGIPVANAPVLNDYELKFHDDIASVVLEQRVKTDKNTLMLGGFYKYKTFDANGVYNDDNGTYSHSNTFANGLHLFSLYAEENYDVSDSLRFVAALKGDFFRYDKEVKSDNQFLARLGFVARDGHYKYKMFYARGYIPLAFYQLYNPENMPYKTNPDLEAIRTRMFSAEAAYKTKELELSLYFVHMLSKDLIDYDRTLPEGFYNSSESLRNWVYELKALYNFDLDNKISAAFVYGENNQDIYTAPSSQVILQSFSRYKRFDIYNELIYLGSYTFGTKKASKSYSYNLACKYHYTDDLSIGVRGENLLDRGYEQLYTGVAEGIAVRDRKVWINMEYLF